MAGPSSAADCWLVLGQRQSSSAAWGTKPEALDSATAASEETAEPELYVAGPSRHRSAEVPAMAACPENEEEEIQ